MNNIINEEVNRFIKQRNFNLNVLNHYRLNELFTKKSLNESDGNVRDIVITLIKNNQWGDTTPAEFRLSLSKSKHPLMLTDYTESELSAMKLFKLKDFNIGYALKNHDGKPYSEIVAVHNNEPNVHNIGDILMQSAIKNGGCYLDHFNTNKLTSLYGSMGFEEYNREPYNPEYDTNGNVKNTYGEIDVIYRKHRSC